MIHYDSNTPNTTLPALLRDLRDETTTLLRQEVALARAELKENVSKIGNQSVQIAAGGLVAFAGVIVLLIGLGLLFSALLVRAGLAPDLAQWLAPAALGLLVALAGLGMFARAKNAMRYDDIAPKKTIESIRESKDWAQNKLQHS